jgi:glutathione S-transferase
MNNLHIWGRLNSINVQKVLWLCEDLKIPFERTDAGMQYGVNKTQFYLQLNPNGLVPVIKDNELVLWESHAILRYLSKKHDVADILYPKSADQAAKIDQWLDWYNTTAWPVMRPLFWGFIRTKPEERNLQELEKTRVQMSSILKILDNQLKSTPWVTGDHFTIADLPLALIAFRWFNLPIEREDYQHLSRWFKQIELRPGYIKYASAPLT